MADTHNRSGLQWFCGVNSSDLDHWGEFSLEIGRNNTCLVDALDVIPHLGFFLLATVVLVLGLCTRYCNSRSKYLIRFPGHSLRWCLSIALIIVLLASLAEGILTDETYIQSHGATRPHLYIPPIAALVAVSTSLVYYQCTEAWQFGGMVILLLIFYVTAGLGEIGKLINLLQLDEGSLEVTRFDLTIIQLICFLLLSLIEINVIRLKVFCRNRHRREDFLNDLGIPGPLYRRDYVNFLSSLVFWWMNWVFLLGYKRSLEIDDLGRLPKSYGAERLQHQIKTEFEREKEVAVKGTHPSLWKVILRIYGPKMTFVGLIKLLGDFAGLVGPVCVSGIVKFVADKYYGTEKEKEVIPHFIRMGEFTSNGFVLIVFTFAAASFQFVTACTAMFYSIFYGMCLRSSLQTMVYEKSLSLSTFATSGGDLTTGQITNHMSTDAMNLLYMFQYFHYSWTVPFLVGLVLYLLYNELGVASLLGSVVYAIVIPCQLFAANYMAKHQKRALELADERLKHSNEIIQGIKLLKSYGWEHLYVKAVEKIRNKELQSIVRLNIAYGIIGCIVTASPLLVTLLTFGTYTAFTGQRLNPGRTFSSLALFNQLTVPLFMLPLVTATIVNGFISTKRLKSFLVAPEVETKRMGDDWRDRRSVEEEDRSYMRESHQETTLDEAVDDVTSDVDETVNILPMTNDKRYLKGYGTPNETRMKKNILPASVAVKVTNGHFTWDRDSSTPIVSDINIEIPVGNLTIIIGAVGSGKSSLVSAILGEMTTLSGTVDFNEYKKTIEVCALQPDIEILAGGDQTEIGEEGINLSGGQKQRISVARAVYSDKDIIILDDPLSALDVHVGSHVFQQAIIRTLLRRKQTVVLVTHQLQYLHHAIKIIVMKGGKIAHQGTLQDIIDEAPELYSEYQQAVKTATESDTDGDEIVHMSKDERKAKLKMQISKEMSKESHGPSNVTKLIEEEEMERGSVSYKVYMYYVRAMTLLMSIGFFAAYVANGGFIVGTNFWLSVWSEAAISTDNTTSYSLSYYIGGYAGLSVGGVVTVVIATAFIAYGSYFASRDLHFTMLRNITRCPMRFFDTTPLGRVLNRLAADTTILDMKLFQSIDATVFFGVGYASGLIVNSIILPIFLVFVIPMMITYYFLAKFYITTSRSLQRLDSVSKSPVFAHFSETLRGVATIRAYSEQNRFYGTVVNRINVNNTAYLYLESANKWAELRLGLIGVTGILVAGVGTIISSLNGTIEPSKVGLAVSYSIMVATYINYAVRFAADTEMQMNAIERIKEYSSIANENYTGDEPPEDWPRHGEINLEGIYVRYAAKLDPVIKNVTATFKAGEKVGICGRTGSGKSSLTLALFRIIDTCKGRILIDDVDISTIPLTLLRQRLAIIPQDPVLFSGTIRQNLDPENRRTDKELWESLEVSQLKETAAQMPRGLDSKVSEGGENFSMGQRQLFCLARAFLRRSRILIMDEATASIDLDTDKILQEVVATVFADCTVLTIAHRVATILDSDSILVLSDGEIVEYDTPGNLLADPNSIFASLVNSNE